MFSPVSHVDDLQFQKSLGERIRTLRLEHGLTQGELGDMCEMEKTGISRIETGRTNPTILTLRKISLALGIELTELLNMPANNG
ncbi:MAG: XRE family transcriptional regulator [Bacteroidetes bacterium]|nr:MAG: XRE family transcriptional regulator [Bacteroidota bacterium]